MFSKNEYNGYQCIRSVKTRNINLYGIMPYTTSAVNNILIIFLSIHRFDFKLPVPVFSFPIRRKHRGILYKEGRDEKKQEAHPEFSLARGTR